MTYPPTRSPRRVIRPAQRSDADQIARLHTQGWRQGYKGLLPDYYLHSIDLEATRQRWLDHFDAPSYLQLLVCADAAGRLLGFTSIGRCHDADCTDEWELWDLWVDAEYRSRGIGAELLGAALQLAPAGRDVTVWVLGANQRGLDFYQRQGAVFDNRSRYTGQAQAVIIRDVRLRWSAHTRAQRWPGQDR